MMVVSCSFEFGLITISGGVCFSWINNPQASLIFSQATGGCRGPNVFLFFLEPLIWNFGKRENFLNLSYWYAILTAHCITNFWLLTINYFITKGPFVVVRKLACSFVGFSIKKNFYWKFLPLCHNLFYI